MAFDIFIKSYTVPDFTDDTVLAKQTQDTDEDATQTPSQDNETLLKKRSFRINGTKLLKKI